MKRVTIYDVAKEAKVSLATVSRVINGLDIVREDTRLRVNEAIEKLGYKPNAIAQGLALQKTTTIALVVPEASFSYTGQIINGLLDVAKIYKYNIKNQTSTLIYEEYLKNPVAEFLKLKVDSQNLTILDPYHKVINILAHNGKLLSKQNFTTPPDFNYNFTENTRYESAEEFSKSEIDLEEFTRVIDFTIQENSLFLIVTQISGRKIIDRLIVRCGMDENFESKIITSSFVPLHFDSNNNLFRYIEKDGQQFVEVGPIKNAIN